MRLNVCRSQVSHLSPHHIQWHWTKDSRKSAEKNKFDKTTSHLQSIHPNQCRLLDFASRHVRQIINFNNNILQREAMSCEFFFVFLSLNRWQGTAGRRKICIKSLHSEIVFLVFTFANARHAKWMHSPSARKHFSNIWRIFQRTMNNVHMLLLTRLYEVRNICRKKNSDSNRIDSNRMRSVILRWRTANAMSTA